MFQNFSRIFINSLLVGLMGLPVANLTIYGQTLPAGNMEASQRLEDSTRRREVVGIKTELGATLTALVVYPDRSGPAPMVVAIHGRGRLESLGSGLSRSTGR